MFQDELQNRVHNGDQAALRELYSRYSREVYAIALTALGNSDSARAVVKQVFYHIYRDLMRSETDLDLAARLSALTNEEIRITRIAAGDLSPDALQAAFFITASAPNTADTMQRIQARMQQDAAPVLSEEPAPTAAEPAADEDNAPFEDDSYNPFEETPQDPVPVLEASEAADDAAADTHVQAPAAEEDPLLVAAPAKKKSRKGKAIAAIILIVLLVIFAWLLCGILMDLGLLPFYDLGYSLFNEYVFDFFRLP